MDTSFIAVGLSCMGAGLLVIGIALRSTKKATVTRTTTARTAAPSTAMAKSHAAAGVSVTSAQTHPTRAQVAAEMRATPTSAHTQPTRERRGWRMPGAAALQAVLQPLGGSRRQTSVTVMVPNGGRRGGTLTPAARREQVRALAASGQSDAAVARETGISQDLIMMVNQRPHRRPNVTMDMSGQSENAARGQNAFRVDQNERPVTYVDHATPVMPVAAAGKPSAKSDRGMTPGSAPRMREEVRNEVRGQTDRSTATSTGATRTPATGSTSSSASSSASTSAPTNATRASKTGSATSASADTPAPAARGTKKPQRKKQEKKERAAARKGIGAPPPPLPAQPTFAPVAEEVAVATGRRGGRRTRSNAASSSTPPSAPTGTPTSSHAHDVQLA